MTPLRARRVPRFSLALTALLVFVPFVVLLVVPAVNAATYYVSSSAGNDAWTGQPGSGPNVGPWKTLARASNQYQPGDRILLRCGDTWNEELRPGGNGTPESPILIGSYGQGPRPIIDRLDDTKDLVGIRLVDQGGYRIVGIEFNRCMTGIYGEYSDGCPTKKYISIEDCYFHDSLKYQHYEDYPKRKIGLGVCFFSHERDNRIVLSDVTVKNCTFRRLASGFWTNSPDNFNKYAGRLYNFANFTFEGCLFEEGYQWQLGIRGVAGGAVRNCITHDIGRGFRSFNGVAGAMFFRCKDWVFEDSEWGFVDIGLGSGDGEAFDFEGTCDNMTMKNCLFHDTDGPGFLLCCYASSPEPNLGITMDGCVLNGKSKRPIGLPRCEIVNTTDWNEVTWRNCRFYLSPGEVLMRVMDPEKEKKSKFVDCRIQNLADACSTPNLATKATASASSETAGHGAALAIDATAATGWQAAAAEEQWLQLDFPGPTKINEILLKEDPQSSIVRYVIEYWHEPTSQWTSCFNGRKIGPRFVAPIVARTTQKVRLRVIATTSGNPGIREFQVYNNSSGNLEPTATGRPFSPDPDPVSAEEVPTAGGPLPETVLVGNPGNKADETGYGAVAYRYRIGKYEVTNAQYCEFLNAVAKNDTHGLYRQEMAGEYGGIIRSGEPGSYTYAVKESRGNWPVNVVSWNDALRYANWLTGGRGSGGTETGSYDLAAKAMPDHAALAAGEKTHWVLASENEWYKAAYYDPDHPQGAGYWDFATRSDQTPAVSFPPGTPPAANYNTGSLFDVGAYKGSASAYGTFDQNGSMWEWNETQQGGNCGVRGGSFYINDNAGYLRAQTRYVSNPPSFEFSNYGFRVVALGGTE